MDLRDLVKLAGIVNPELLNRIEPTAEVEEADGAGFEDATTRPDEEVMDDPMQSMGSDVDLSLRRYLKAKGDHVTVDEDIYPDFTVEDVNEAYAAFKEGKYKSDAQRKAVHAAKNEASMGAPDYNPAKASAGGPGYASMPQQIKLAGDSIWDKEGTNPPMVTITDYEVSEEGDGYVSVTVEHDGPMEVYTDSGFEKAVSDMIGMEVEFSEQGMQQDGVAHLEGTSEMESVEESHYPHLSRFQMLYGIEDVEQYKEMADDAQSMDMDEFIDTYSNVIDMASDFWEDHQTEGVDENAFNQAAAAAARANKDSFEFDGKTYKTKMDKSTAHKLDDDVDMLRKLAGLS